MTPSAQLQVTTTFQSQYQTLLAPPHLPRLTLNRLLPSKSIHKRLLSGSSASFSTRHLTATKLATPHNPSPSAGGSI
ncbi:hypothetical protein COCVIDRAFT_103404, partial [Bipolaris victoriae FI3]